MYSTPRQIFGFGYIRQRNQSHLFALVFNKKAPVSSKLASQNEVLKTKLRQFLTHSWSVMSQFSMQETDSASQSTSQSFLSWNSLNFRIWFSATTKPNHPKMKYFSHMPAMKDFRNFGLFFSQHVRYSHDERSY